LVTGKPADKYKMRAPSLRNVARTGSYMHDGSQETLGDVLTYYYRTAPAGGPERLPLDIRPLLGNSISEITALLAFLEALTGEEPKVAVPELPQFSRKP
jgi:cytochrome c peroxidase